MVNSKGIKYSEDQMEKEKISKKYLCEKIGKGKKLSPYLLCMCSRIYENKFNMSLKKNGDRFNIMCYTFKIQKQINVFNYYYFSSS